jgi:hypothetical protein
MEGSRLAAKKIIFFLNCEPRLKLHGADDNGQGRGTSSHS